MFPHHENEHAQSTCAHGTERMASFWLHNGMLAVKGRKMSKSDGNFITVRDLLAEHPGRGEAVRMALMSAHYRQPLDFTRRKVAEAVDTLDRLYSALRGPAVPPGDAAGLDSGVGAALLDDLNTPLALARLHELAGLVHAAADGEARARARGSLRAGARLRPPVNCGQVGDCRKSLDEISSPAQRHLRQAPWRRGQRSLRPRDTRCQD